MNNELELKEIQKISLEILIEIDKICANNNFRYFLAYGSLLGAARHKGFIPWDDDIDIMMPRNDYEQFIKYCEDNKKEIKPLEIFSIKNPNYPFMISRLSNSKYILDFENEENYGMGIFVDIYPIDGVSNNYKKMIIRKRKASIYSSMCYLASRKHYERGTTESRYKLLIKKPLFYLSKRIGKDFFIKKLEKMRKKFNYDETKYVGCLVWGSDREKGIFDRELFSESIKLEFENYKFSAPKGYKKVLSQLYGDYMKLPPKEKQIAHHFYKAFKK